MTSCQLVTVALAKYSNPAWNVEKADECRLEVAKLLQRHGAQVEDWTHRANQDGITHALSEWSGRHDQAQVLYWVGHGEHSDDGYLIALADSKGDLTDFNAVTGERLHAAVRNQHRQRGDNHPDSWTLLILDTCGSGAGAKQLWDTFTKAEPRNVGVIAAVDEGAAYAGRFPEMLERALNGFTSNDTGGIPLRELMRRFEDILESTATRKMVHSFFSRAAVLPLPVDADQPSQTTVDTYAELRAVLAHTSPETRNHFYAKAQGAEIGEPAWHFTGRTAERRTITSWLQEAPQGLFVVSGVAGSGKSALLGMLLASSDPAVRAALEAAGQPPIPADLRPADQAFDAIVNLSGRTIRDSVAMLAAGLHLTDTDNPDALIDQVAGRPDTDRVTVMVDALDEARDPFLVAALLRRLGSQSEVRVLVGTRQSLNEGPDNPTPPDSGILDALGAPPEQVIKLPLDPDAVFEYTRSRLAAKLPDSLTDRIDDLASAIAGYEQPFLFARLAVHEIAAELGWTVPGADLDRLLDSGHSGIFAHTVARLRHEKPQAEALMHALTYARGNGFPRTDGVWAVAASAISNTTITDTAVEQALLLAAPYIMQDTENGQTVYRLAHRTFAEWYRQADRQ